MVKEVIWTEQAAKDFRQVLNFLNTEWNSVIAEEFYNRVFWIIDLLIDFPEMGILIKQRLRKRKILITRFNYLVYQENNN
ncbi:MAG TPA: type II toxin-antitoxin system RelE/ParE family toxin [Ignavibacteria bacterium]|mgnify:CR=1 FL=1|nr:type II toxin-antitoxin system RelE/ParE family toxin [Ignavibacteria bacterium]HMQ98861.1 type II toxin-antitoxin system RelE/ParE family toxin [Ignavibacteria bacterium]